MTGIGVVISAPPPYTYSAGAPLYGFFNPTSMDMTPDILISTWITDRIALEPSVGFFSSSNITAWRFGLTYINHFGHGQFLPFALVRAKTYLTPTLGRDFNHYSLALGGGAEYFVGDKFSISGECQLNYFVPLLVQSSDFTDTKVNITYTGVAISGRFYLN